MLAVIFGKSIPLEQGYRSDFAAIVTGRKRFQTEQRAAMEPIELFAGRFRFNPLAGWSWAELQNYIPEYKLPPHPLAEDGFCFHRVHSLHAPYQSGRKLSRWPLGRLGKQECGIHAGHGRRRHLMRVCRGADAAVFCFQDLPSRALSAATVFSSPLRCFSNSCSRFSPFRPQRVLAFGELRVHVLPFLLQFRKRAFRSFQFASVRLFLNCLSAAPGKRALANSVRQISVVAAVP